jgi:DNA polymerase III epsilon subunit family exonuclease
MSLYPNLISNSVLVNDTIALLEAAEGPVTAVDIVDYVLKISRPEPHFAKLLVSDLIQIDPRLKFANDTADGTVEFVPLNFESRDLHETDFVVFDLETTGAKVPPCRVTEIGAFKVSGGKIVDEYQTLINPLMPIPTFIAELTGISDEMVRSAPQFHEVAEEFLEFIGDAVLVAHNAPFDIRFINHEIGRVFEGYRLGNPHLCTVQLSRKLLPDIENHRLHTVADYYSITIENRHRAGDDALATAKVFIHFLSQLNEMGISELNKARDL